MSSIVYLILYLFLLFFFFFFNATATTEIYTLSLHDALPISNPDRRRHGRPPARSAPRCRPASPPCAPCRRRRGRSEEHTSELQSRPHLVCRLLLEKKKKTKKHKKHNQKTNKKSKISHEHKLQ